MTKQQIQSELKAAMMAKDTLKLSTLRMLLGAVQTAEVTGEKHDATPDEILGLLQREVKRRKEAMDEYQMAGRTDLARQEGKELVILQSYLPEQLTSEEIEALAKAAITATEATRPQDFGKVMKELSPKIKGKADGKTVSDVVRKLLGQ